MSMTLGRRAFLQAAAAGGALYAAAAGASTGGAASAGSRLVSPGCRRSRVRVGKVYIVGTNPLWPTPTLDPAAEMQRYEGEFARMKKELADVDFVGSELVKSPDDVKRLADAFKDVDGIVAIHFTMGMGQILPEILNLKRPTVLFAVPYSGHEWTGFGGLRKQDAGALLECMLTSDLGQLAAAVRPFRAIHHLREAKILNVSERREAVEYTTAIREKFGTEIKTVARERMLAAYEAVDLKAAQAEAEQWMAQARQVVEPPKEEIIKSCRLALAFERLLNEEDATVITVDCYGTMYHKLPAFPCIGFTRLNDMGLGGICESDLRSAMTHILFQGLAGKPGFISDPTVDESSNSIILAHCLGTRKMDGPEGEAAPYRLRTIMERQEGAVPQVDMRIGQRVTQAELIGADLLLCFTGEVTDTPDTERGCRTKITVKVDGDVTKLWHNWSNGLHRVTCYGDLRKDLERFCRFKNVRLVNEAEEAVEA